MSEDINKVVIVGRLTRDSELSYTNTGTAICKFSIAANSRKKSGDQWIDEANFFDCQIWGKRGESLNQYLMRGSRIAIEGSLRQERWEKDGAKRSKVTIEASNIQLLDSKSDGQQPPQGGANPARAQPQQNGNQPGGPPPGVPVF